MASGGPRYDETYLEGMLECCICVEPVNDPHTLQKCLHTVCKACIDKLKAGQNNDPPGVYCPVCRKFSKEDMIIGNFFIKDLSELHKSVKEQKRAICNRCSDNGKTVDASCRCLECKERLCQDCKAAHQTFKLLKGHKIVALGDDSELVVDNLVFCSIHTDKPLELYCEPCNALMCMTCKVTKHNTHESQTIDEALQHMIPEIEKSTQFIEEIINVLEKSLEDVEIKIKETKKSYEKCHNDVDKTADARIQQIEAARVTMKQDLQVKEKAEIGKLESVKDNLKMKQGERENLKKVVRMSLDRAQHVTLISEFIQGGLQDNIKELKDQPEAPVEIHITQPQLNTNNAEWEKIMQQGVVGSVLYKNISVIVAACASEVGGSRMGSRYWDVNLGEYFLKNFKKVLEIKTGKVCFKMRLLKEKIWAPAQSGNFVNVYDKEGSIVDTIGITYPMSVEQTGNGDIFIACHSNSGLYLLDDNDTRQKICDGSFADVYAHCDKVYALEYEKKMIMEFSCRSDTADVKQIWGREKAADVKQIWGSEKAADVKQIWGSEKADDVKQIWGSEKAADVKQIWGSDKAADVKQIWGREKAADVKQIWGSEKADDVKQIWGSEKAADVKQIWGSEKAADVKQIWGSEKAADVKQIWGSEKAADVKQIWGSEKAADVKQRWGSEKAADVKQIWGSEKADDVKQRWGREKAADVKQIWGSEKAADVKQIWGSEKAADVKQIWGSEKEWRVDEASQHDKLIVTGDDNIQLFVSHHGRNIISQYNTQGQCTKQFDSWQTEGRAGRVDFIDGPWLCGIDRQSHLLVADQIHNVYKILDPGTGQWRSTGMRGGSFVYDAILDEDGNLWLSYQTGKTGIISKHEPQ